MGKKAECRIFFPNGEVLEIHEPLTTQALLGLAAERDEAVEMVYRLINRDSPDVRAAARALLKFHGKM